MARPKEFESPTFRLGGERSILLSYGRIFYAFLILTQKGVIVNDNCALFWFTYEVF